MTEQAKSEADALEFECDLPDPPEKVWRALTVPELLAAWMMPNDIKPETGSRFAFDGAEVPIDCEVLDAEPGRLLRYSWRERSQTGDADRLDSIVTFTLDRTISGGTHLRIVHDGFVQAATPAVAMLGSGCRFSFDAYKPKLPVAANAPRLLMRAA
jgi:uncharacterized protein YndB with AHSA1/START domain